MPIPIQPLPQFAELCRRPVGSTTFRISSPDVFKSGEQSGLIFEVPSDGHYLRVDRTAGRTIRFFHSSPGTGTRVATIDLNGSPDFEDALFVLNWTPEEISMYLGATDVKMELLKATGMPSQIIFKHGADGVTYELDAAHVKASEVRVHRVGQAVLEPTAVEVWRNTLDAVELLWTAKSDQGDIFEVLLANSTITMSVTGFENYCKTRLLEVEKEGVKADSRALFNAFASAREREANLFEEISARAAATNHSILSAVLKIPRINFQKFSHVKLAFSKGYGIKIGDIGVPGHVINELRKFIAYRHRIVHISPTLGVLNLADIGGGTLPVFSNRKCADRAVELFNTFVDSLHCATLALPQRG
ncbi:MAG: hypothetical protein JWP34_3903 [Massilia sp.]|nr:hypothetical protein [Massilia sp.]